jgi:Protein of unknown function (DUF1822)
MLSKIAALSKIFPEHIWIEITDQDLSNAELQSQKYSNQTSKKYAYINSLVRNSVIKWLRENLDLENQQITVNIPETWEFVNGSSVQINPPKTPLKRESAKRLILIPSDVIDLEELVIPQEWVDISTWAGDYYLPVQIELEEKYLHIWGYVSREKLKAKAEYDQIYRNYHIDADHLIDEMDLLWMAAEICQEKGAVKSLSGLSVEEGEKLINQLSKNARYSPRLDVEFEQWEKLLHDESLLKRLYQQRVEPETQRVKEPINLMKWLEDQFDQAAELGWLLLSDVQPQWSGVLSTKVERAKLINLQVKPQPQSVILILEVTAENDGKYGLSIQINPSKTKFLPVNLNLAFCLTSGEKLQSITSTKSDNCMKLDKFLCDRGDEFRIEVSLEGVTVIENFCI